MRPGRQPDNEAKKQVTAERFPWLACPFGPIIMQKDEAANYFLATFIEVRDAFAQCHYLFIQCRVPIEAASAERIFGVSVGRFKSVQE